MVGTTRVGLDRVGIRAPGPLLRRSAFGCEATAAAVAACLPAALTKQGYGPSTANAVIGAAACSILLLLLGSRPAGVRVAVAVAVGAVAGARFDPAVGIALVAGLVLGDWVIRGRPVSRRIGPPRGAEVPTAILLGIAVVRMDPRWAAYGPGPRIIVLVACVGFVAQLVRAAGASPAWPLALAALSVPLARRGFEFEPSTAIVVPVATALMTAALLGVGSMPHTWGARLRGVAPFLLLLPGATWWMWNVSSWWAGTLVADEVGFAAWDQYTSALPRSVLTTKAALAMPAWLLASLTIGGATVLHGQRALVAAAGGIVALALWAIALASAWVWSIDSAVFS